MDKYWEDLIFTICKGDASEMAALRRYWIEDFFNYVENKIKKNG